MSRNLTGVVLVALLASGCALIQSWGDYRGEGGMDAGADAGAGDAGVDAGDAGVCDFCEEEGCDVDTCELSAVDGCYHCELFREGEPCELDLDCADDLICELGVCLHPCARRADCVAAGAVGEECVPAAGRSVCIDHGCDPVCDACEGDTLSTTGRCFFGAPADNLGLVGSICAILPNTELGPYELCGDPDVGICGNSLLCRNTPGDPERRCYPLCYVGGGAIVCPDPRFGQCDLGFVCGGIETEDGMGVVFQGRVLGTCIPAVPDCDPTNEMTCPPGQGCQEDPTAPTIFRCMDCTLGERTTCFAGQRCAVDDRSRMTTRCVRGGCSDRTDCPGVTPRGTSITPACVAGYCVVSCSDPGPVGDAECVAEGYDRCASGFSTAGITSCVTNCPLGTTCRDGECGDADGDDNFECFP